MVSKQRVYRFVQDNGILLLALLWLPVLGGITGDAPSHYVQYVDWRTIFTLTGLLLTTTALKESGVFSHLARGFVRTMPDERRLALALVSTASLLSMVLTNDIALFIVIPLTLGLEEITGNNFLRFIILEALAVNVGSTLSPIGNPQNIFLWHQWEISFFRFVGQMFPLFLLLQSLLFGMVLVLFPSRPVHFARRPDNHVQLKLFYLSAFLFLCFLISVELRWMAPMLVFVVLVYLFSYRRIFRVADWGLILLFVVVFVDLHLFSEIGWVQELGQRLNWHDPLILLGSGILTSQLISNVPAAILLSHFTQDWHTIAYAVNVGGNGLITASFANLIALRLTSAPGRYRRFHLYSFAFLLLSAAGTVLLLLR